MIRPVQRLARAAAMLITGVLLAGPLGGCATDPKPPAGAARTTLLLPGVFGDGAGYNGLRQAVAEGGSIVKTVSWGMPKLLFVANFSNTGIHEKAEAKLAAEIDATVGDLDLIGHSAGCGVILGALKQCRRDVRRVVLIAPSVSPQYNIGPALKKSAVIHYFSSDRDTYFLKWRCGTFGGYDGVKTPAAGYAGFATADPKLIEHPYDPAWEQLGNAGGHSDAIGERFVREIILPLLTATHESGPLSR